MYGETLFIAAAPARRGWSAMAGFTVQCAILGTALLVPMLNPEILPRVLIAGILTAPSPPPPPLAPSSAPTMAARVHRVVRE
jgi:protein TonB